MKTIRIVVIGAACAAAGLFAVKEIIRARTIPASNACPNNLRLVESAKSQWALEFSKTNGSVVTWQDIVPYVARGPGDKIPKCPHGGVYTIGKIGEDPTCSIGGYDTLPH